MSQMANKSAIVLLYILTHIISHKHFAVNMKIAFQKATGDRKLSKFNKSYENGGRSDKCGIFAAHFTPREWFNRRVRKPMTN